MLSKMMKPHMITDLKSQFAEYKNLIQQHLKSISTLPVNSITLGKIPEHQSKCEELKRSALASHEQLGIEFPEQDYQLDSKTIKRIEQLTRIINSDDKLRILCQEYYLDNTFPVCDQDLKILYRSWVTTIVSYGRDGLILTLERTKGNYSTPQFEELYIIIYICNKLVAGNVKHDIIKSYAAFYTTGDPRKTYIAKCKKSLKDEKIVSFLEYNILFKKYPKFQQLVDNTIKSTFKRVLQINKDNGTIDDDIRKNALKNCDQFMRTGQRQEIVYQQVVQQLLDAVKLQFAEYKKNITQTLVVIFRLPIHSVNSLGKIPEHQSKCEELKRSALALHKQLGVEFSEQDYQLDSKTIQRIEQLTRIINSDDKLRSLCQEYYLDNTYPVCNANREMLFKLFLHSVRKYFSHKQGIIFTYDQQTEHLSIMQFELLYDIVYAFNQFVAGKVEDDTLTELRIYYSINPPDPYMSNSRQSPEDNIIVSYYEYHMLSNSTPNFQKTLDNYLQDIMKELLTQRKLSNNVKKNSITHFAQYMTGQKVKTSYKEWLAAHNLHEVASTVVSSDASVETLTHSISQYCLT